MTDGKVIQLQFPQEAENKWEVTIEVKPRFAFLRAVLLAMVTASLSEFTTRLSTTRARGRTERKRSCAVWTDFREIQGEEAMKMAFAAVTMMVVAGMAMADQKIEYTSGVAVTTQKATFEPSEKLVMENGECHKETSRLKKMNEITAQGKVMYVPEIEVLREKVACPS